MLNSRDIDLLRPDVAANCRKWVERCKAAGLNVLVTQTVRDNEYQASLYAQGRTKPGSIVTNAKTPTFHALGAGLAFDFCKNKKGEEYSDSAFFRKAAAIAKEMGFSWGGDWTSIVDPPHIQWDNHGEWTGAMIRAGKLPPTMPLYINAEEEIDMITEESIKNMSDGAVLALANRIQTIVGRQEQTGNLAKELQEAVKMGITDGSTPKAFCTRAQAAIMVKRSAMTIIAEIRSLQKDIKELKKQA